MKKLFVLLATVMLLATACSASEEPQAESGQDTATGPDGATETSAATEDAAEEAPGGGEDITATFSNIAETPTLDPAVAFSSDGILFVRNVYEGLLDYLPASTELQPGLATEWSVSDDGLTYSFTIREGVTFHDGSELTAEVARAGLQRILDVNQGPASLMASVESIAAPSEMELEVTLEQKDVYFLSALPKLPIVSQQALEEHATDADPTASEWFTTNAAGTGPYQLERWDRNQAIRLRAYDDYWRPFEGGTPTQVVLRVDPDIATAMQLLQSGEIDMMGAVGPDEAVLAEGMPGVKVVEQPTFEIRMLPLNVTKPPLDDVRVREAISLAFDYDAMVEFFQGYGEVPRGPLPSSLEAVGDDFAPMETDLQRARELLAEAGHPDGGFTLTYLGLTGLSYEEFAGNVLQDQLGQLGITVEQQLVPWPQMVEIQSNPDTAAHISFLNQSLFTADPTYLLRSAYSTATHADKGGYNWSYYSNSNLDEMLDEVRTIEDEDERAQMIAEMQQMIIEDHAAVYVVEPRLAQPVREGWDVTYETLDYNYVVDFFESRTT